MIGLAPATESSPATTEATEWIATPFRLEFFLGEYLLRRLDLRAMQPDRFFLDLPEDPEELARSAPTRGAVVMPSVPVRVPMHRLGVSGGRIRYLVYRFPRYLVRLDGTFEGYMKGLSSKTRYAVRKAIRQVANHSGDSFEVKEYRSPGDVGAFLEAAAGISRRTYQTKLLKAGLSDDEATRTRLLERARTGEFRSFILWVEGQPISYMLGTTRKKIWAQEHIGFDPAFHSLDPGRALYGMAIERLYEVGDIEMVDFTPGGGEHKEKLSTEVVDCVDLVYFPLGPKGIALVGSHLLLQGVSGGIVRIMTALGVKTKVKQLLRGRRKAATAN